MIYYSDSVRSIVCTNAMLFGCCFVLCVVVASRVSCARRGGGPISCCGTKAQSTLLLLLCFTIVIQCAVKYALMWCCLVRFVLSTVVVLCFVLLLRRVSRV